ncbi:Trm112 family protein [Albibacterium sp.]|uniref:Trm112 family protein n=1 Tax=Albibacterium sp. TaxID=2952885 RepID=UPI002BAB68B5|nr:Trm112 family protein [Albibacterium sp.]HUH18304.1 Trm112 family protein [Albibacterium sp.]
MRIATINKLCCPFDKADLSLQIITQDIDKNILEGLLTCSQCNRYFPIVKGIPIMSPDEFRESKLEQPLIESWQDHLQGKELKNFRLGATITDNQEA